MWQPAEREVVRVLRPCNALWHAVCYSKIHATHLAAELPSGGWLSEGVAHPEGPAGASAAGGLTQFFFLQIADFACFPTFPMLHSLRGQSPRKGMRSGTREASKAT